MQTASVSLCENPRLTKAKTPEAFFLFLAVLCHRLILTFPLWQGTL